MRSADNYVLEHLGKDLIGAEVGVLNGQHALEMLSGLPLKKLYLIDPWGYYTINAKEAYSQELLETYYKNVLKIKEKYPDIVKVIRLESVEAAETLKDIDFDYVYVDANHENPYVKYDLEAWFPRIKHNGVLGGHDFHMSHVYSAVTDFVNPMLSNTRIIFTAGNYDWIIHKI